MIIILKSLLADFCAAFLFPVHLCQLSVITACSLLIKMCVFSTWQLLNELNYEKNPNYDKKILMWLVSRQLMFLLVSEMLISLNTWTFLFVLSLIKTILTACCHKWNSWLGTKCFCWVELHIIIGWSYYSIVLGTKIIILHFIIWNFHLEFTHILISYQFKKI